MGTRFRKSVNLGGGMRLNISKSGIGYSAGVKGARITKTARGTTRTTLSVPGTGLSYVKETGTGKRAKSTGGYGGSCTYDSGTDDYQTDDSFGGLTEEQIRDKLMRQVCELDLKCKNAEAKLGKNHPEVVKIRASVDHMRLELAKMGIVDFEYPTGSPEPIRDTAPEEPAPVPRVSTVHCPDCGEEMTAGARFCPHCGQAMGKEAGQAAMDDFRDKPAGWGTIVVRVLLWVLAVFALLLTVSASPVGKVFGVLFIADVLPIRQTRRIPVAVRIPAAIGLFFALALNL